MMHPRLTGALSALAVLFSGVAARRARAVLAPPAPAPRSISPGPALPRAVPADTLETAMDLLVSADPFRLANAPAGVRFIPGTAGVGTPPTPAVARPPRPLLVLKAVIGGPPWQAVVSGLAGESGTVVRAGDTFDALVVARVTADTVIIRAPDTTWTLTLRRYTP